MVRIATMPSISEGVGMWRFRRVEGGLLVGIALGVLVAVVAGVSGVLAAAIAPPGYQNIQGPNTDINPSSFDYGGQLACPIGTVVWGGGVLQDVFGPGGATESIETTAPNGNAAWRARVNDTGVYEAQFSLGVICAKKPKVYKIVSKSVDNPAGALTTATATCPTGTVVLSGGALSTSDSSSVQLAGAWPTSQTAFRVRMFNGTTSDATLFVSAVCGSKPAGYAIKRHTVATPPSVYTQFGGATCPSTAAVIGGGLTVSVPGGGTPPVLPLFDSIGVGNPGSAGWETAETNTSTETLNVQSDAICAA
jgi:hypothetical protein